jgi:hypothetical protein
LKIREIGKCSEKFGKDKDQSSDAINYLLRKDPYAKTSVGNMPFLDATDMHLDSSS